MTLDRRGFLRGAVAAGAGRLLLPPALVVGAASAVPGLAYAQGDAPRYDPNPARAGSRLDALVPFIDPTLEIFNPHTKDRVRVRFFSATGYDIGAVQQLNHIWRDWRQDVAPQIDPRLFWAMAAVRTSAMKDGHDGVVTLLSGYRTQATTDYLRSRGVNASRNSQHMRACAMDFTLHDVPATKVAGFVEWLQVGGTGYYPNNNFTHADTGSIRQWRG